MGKELHLGALPLPCPANWCLPEKTLYTSDMPVSTVATQGTPPDCQALVASGVYACSPTGLYKFAYI